MVERWWQEAEAHQVLPLDDRFGERFAENAARVHGDRTHYEFWAGMGHLPTDAAPDVRDGTMAVVADPSGAVLVLQQYSTQIGALK